MPRFENMRAQSVCLLCGEFHYVLYFPKVLMWRTNFDRRNYRDVLQQHSRRTTPDPPPHLGDFPPRVPHLHHPLPSDIQVGDPNTQIYIIIL